MHSAEEASSQRPGAISGSEPLWDNAHVASKALLHLIERQGTGADCIQRPASRSGVERATAMWSTEALRPATGFSRFE